MGIFDFSWQTWLDTEKHEDIPREPIFDAWRLKPKTDKEFLSLSRDAHRLTLSQLAYFAWFGNLAPKTHNVPIDLWRQGEKENTIELWADRMQILDQSDKEGRQGVISLGCVCQNIEIAASCYGFSTDVQLVASEDALKPFHEGEKRYVKTSIISFTKDSTPRSHEWLHAMLTRKTVRSIYDETVQLPADAIENIQKFLAVQFPDVQLSVVTDRSQLFALAKIQQTSEDAVYNKDAFTFELHKWLHGGKEAGKPYGMRGAEFGMDEAFAKNVHDAFGHIKGKDLSPHQIAVFATGSKAMFESSSAAMVLSTEKDGLKERFDAGRALEYAVLFLHTLGFSSAVYAAIIEKELDFKLQLANTMLKQLLGITGVPQSLFRVGKLLSQKDYERPHSSRRSIEEAYLAIPH